MHEHVQKDLERQKQLADAYDSNPLTGAFDREQDEVDTILADCRAWVEARRKEGWTRDDFRQALAEMVLAGRAPRHDLAACLRRDFPPPG